MAETSVVVLGGSGFVGSRLLEVWAADSDQKLVAPTHAELDVLDRRALAAFLRQTDAAAVVNLAAWADVDAAEVQRGDRTGRVYALNAALPGHLAELCGELRKHLLHVSTDYVFDGTSAERPYTEGDPTNPLCWYAETKLAGERAVLDSGARICVARIEMPFSALDFPKLDAARTFLRRLEAGQQIQAVQDQRITPVFLDDAVAALGLLSRAQTTGIVHVAASDWTTPYRFASSIAQRLGLNQEHIRPADFEMFAAHRLARRPQHSWMDVSLFSDQFGRDTLRPVEVEVDTWANQLQEVRGRTGIPTVSARSVR